MSLRVKRMGAGASSQPGIPGINIEISNSVVDLGSESTNEASTQVLFLNSTSSFYHLT